MCWFNGTLLNWICGLFGLSLSLLLVTHRLLTHLSHWVIRTLFFFFSFCFFCSFPFLFTNSFSRCLLRTFIYVIVDHYIKRMPRCPFNLGKMGTAMAMVVMVVMVVVGEVTSVSLYLFFKRKNVFFSIELSLLDHW